MKKRIILFTNCFPFAEDSGETYLKTEIEYIASKFEIVVIIATQIEIQTDAIINLPSNVLAYAIGKTFINKVLKYPIFILKGLFSKKNYYYHNEEKKANTFFKRLFLLYFYGKSKYSLTQIKKHIPIGIIRESDLFYCYRFFDTTFTAIQLAEIMHVDCRVICRAHGYDLYENANRFDYLPFRPYMLQRIDKVFTCSDHGKEYLSKKYSGFEKKIVTSRLGSDDPFSNNLFPKKNGSYFCIVSCSNIIPLKRVDKIKRVVLLVNNVIPVKWIHIGGGPGLDKMVSDGSYDFISFLGQKSHSFIVDFYRKQYIDLFINLSTTEGIPQAIMEAFSCGIPAIGTNVGGNAEIIDDGVNGFIVDVEEDDKDVANIIINYYKGNYKDFREHARDKWEKYYNSRNNADLFTSYLRELI